MDDKTFKMVSGVTTGLESIGVSLVAFFAPPMAPAICAAVPIVGTAILSALKLFMVNSDQK